MVGRYWYDSHGGKDTDDDDDDDDDNDSWLTAANKSIHSIQLSSTAVLFQKQDCRTCHLSTETGGEVAGLLKGWCGALEH